MLNKTLALVEHKKRNGGSMKRVFWGVASLILIGACSDNQLGDRGLVRFSQVVNFAETDDFTAPIAAKKPMFIVLQRPDGTFLEDDTFTELTLRVEDNENPGKTSDNAVVFPLGFAQYGVILDRPGPFRLVAEQRGIFLDGLVIQSQTMAGIRFASTARVTTFTDQCITSEEIDSDLSSFLLHFNQEIEVSIVPETLENQPMIGLLALTADSPDGLSLDSPIFGQGVTPNELIIRPGNALLGFPVSLDINEVESNTKLSVEMQTTAEDAIVTCP
jgi:hypothetical protein